MAALTTQVVDLAGITASYVAATVGGDTFSPGDGVEFCLKNGSGVSVTATLATPGTVDGLAVADRPLVVAAGAEGRIRVPTRLYAKADGQCDVTYSAVTTVTVGVFKVA